MRRQLPLIEVDQPDLASYDAVIVNSSAGKDSQASLDVAVEAATAAGVRDRLIVVHADLGRMEWPGTIDLAREHAEHYRLPFAVVRNRGWRDLLARIESRGRWPDSMNRYCTSEFKTGQVYRVMTAVVKELGLDRQARILNVLGMRADESRKRAAMAQFEFDKGASNKTVRHVERWLPIHGWNVEDVWERNAQAGTRHHWAYDLGMPRLSCSFCVFASRQQLVLSARIRPDLAREYAEVEMRIGHRFTQALSIADVVDQAAALPSISIEGLEHRTGVPNPPTVDGWAA